MQFGRRNGWTAAAFALVLAIGAASTAGAQQAPAGAQGRGGGQAPAGARGGGRGGAPYTPAAGAKDLRAVLFNWMWHQGMLKGADERDMVATLEYQAKGGTIQVDGQPCTLSKFRESTNYQTFSQRIQYTCTRPNKQTYSNIEVVSWQYAWNEDTRGAEIAGTKGKVAAMPAAVQERLIRIWASPQGAAKSALAGTMDTWRLGANPGTVIADGVMKAGNTSLSFDAAGKPVLTFPIPGVEGATGTATLDAKYMVEKVVVTQGATTTEFTYSNYQDWNNPLHKIEVYYAGRLTERRNGAVVRDLTTSETETGNVYVVVPVPPSVQKAMNVTTKAPAIVWARTEPPTNTTAPTPRIGGHPDLTGGWAEFNIGWIGNYGNRRCGPDAGGVQAGNQPDRRLRALLTLALRHAGSSSLQAGALGQGAAARHVDQQGRSGHDLPAAGASASGPAAAHLPDGERHHVHLRAVSRCGWRIPGIPHDPD